MEQTIKLPKTYRYFTYGDLEKAETIWFVLHGYGQLPAYFIRKFHSLDPEKHFIVAPEGMHRFYLKGTSGRVGASWMTKEARLDDIEDNIAFLNALANQFTQRKDFKKRVLLGFSQGGATAARWHELGNWKADNFILWASVFPPDLTLPESKGQFVQSSNHFVVGDEDEYYKEEDILQMQHYLYDQGLHFTTTIYNGNHSIDIDCLKQLERQLQQQ